KRNLKNEYSLLTRSPLRTGIIHQQASTLITLATVTGGLFFACYPAIVALLHTVDIIPLH
ncbi:TPA: hypothetical protein ACHGDY_005507, partial [Escherichia coli]